MHYSIVNRNGRVTRVKNLGWLLRNWQDVTSLEVREATPDYQSRMIECVLSANLRCGGYYETSFSSSYVLSHWINRPVFKGVPLDWYGVKTTVGQHPASIY
jgi:hypothetical protein